MTIPVRVLGVAGSLRAASYNRALLRAAVELAPDEMRIDTFDLAEIPLYNRLTDEQTREFLRDFLGAFGDLDGDRRGRDNVWRSCTSRCPETPAAGS